MAKINRPALVACLTILIAGCGSGSTNSTADSSGATSTIVKSAPTAPLVGNVVADSASVIVNFTAPSNDGGDPITQYTATCSASNTNSISANGTGSPITVSGLTNGFAYTCGVVAKNSIGDSAVASSSAVTPSFTAGVLKLNLTALDNYASPLLPRHYDTDVFANDNTPANNQINNMTATLGRVMFFDKQLSFNNTVACASCHQPTRGFEDTQRFSRGFNGTDFTTAHSMRLANGRFFRPGTTFWDKRASSIELQASQPIQNSIEMGFDATHGGLPSLLTKMQGLGYYPELFRSAFGDANITEARIQSALAQYQRSMISSSSRWDTGYASNYNPNLADKGLSLTIAGFTAQEERGRVLFLLGPAQGGVGCARCHVAPTFALAANSQSNGLDAGETRSFKSPSLKNIALSSAFMHDGRFTTLTQVVQHYSTGVQAGPALDNRLIDPATGQPRRLNLSTNDIAALVAFMSTLTDPVLSADIRFSNPFK
jgi:cytochrome c peroxidase